MHIYDPSRWYWTVAGDRTQAWSSAKAAYVPATDPDLAAWLAGGSTPSSIVSEAELAEVLANAGLARLGPQLPASPPSVISDRQFFQQLAVQNLITQDEALAAVQTGAIPAEMQPLIAALPAAQQFAAKMKLCGATQFDIADPITGAIAQGYGWTAAQLGTFWAAAAAL